MSRIDTHLKNRTPRHPLPLPLDWEEDHDPPQPVLAKKGRCPCGSSHRSLADVSEWLRGFLIARLDRILFGDAKYTADDGLCPIERLAGKYGLDRGQALSLASDVMLALFPEEFADDEEVADALRFWAEGARRIGSPTAGRGNGLLPTDGIVPSRPTRTLNPTDYARAVAALFRSAE